MKEFKASDKQANTQLYLGIAVIVLSIVLLILAGRGIALLPAILLLMNGIFYKRNALITLREEHMELRYGPLAPVSLIKYSDLISLNVISKKKVTFKAVIKGKEKNLRIPVRLFSKEDSEYIIQFLTMKLEEIKAAA